MIVIKNYYVLIRKTEIWINDYTSTFSASPSPSHTFTSMKTSSDASTLTTAESKFDILFSLKTHFYPQFW